MKLNTLRQLRVGQDLLNCFEQHVVAMLFFKLSGKQNAQRTPAGIVSIDLRRAGDDIHAAGEDHGCPGFAARQVKRAQKSARRSEQPLAEAQLNLAGNEPHHFLQKPHPAAGFLQ